MASFYEDASLVVIPSGYKTSKIYAEKPTDGSGDLTFTRASDATRVASNGLIEKVRTNHVLQSNTFNTTWVATTLTLTSGATAPDGTATAWTAAVTAVSGILQQAVTLTGLRTFSIYAKQGTLRYLYMGAYGGTISYATFDLQTGTIAAGTNARIESVGNGWYRCTCHSADGTTGGIQIYPTDTISAGSLTSGNILIYESQYETGDIATDYIPTTTAAVSVGPVSNVPRLDYLGSSCPRLLLEPQRTNLALYSEQFDNAGWSKDGVTVTANTTISPDGYQDADTINATAVDQRINQTITVSASTQYTFSFYAKKGTMTTPRYTVFDLSNSAFILSQVDYSSLVNTSTWSRITATFTTPAGCTSIGIYPINGATTGTIFLWGAQLEAGAYATSYIPTLGASVTRVADAATTASVPSLIGQTEGTMFIEFNRTNTLEAAFFMLSNLVGTTTNAYQNSFYFLQQANGTMVVEVYVSAVPQVLFTVAALSVGNHKMALAYKANDFALYVDGVQLGTDTSGSVPTTNFLSIGGAVDGGAQKQSVNQALLFKTRLTNAQLQELTSL
jgi:hypothetical protein